MAAPVALNAAFVRMGFSAEVATTLADENKENLTLESLQYLDDKGIKILCAFLRKPGGTIEGLALAGDGVAPRIPNPGVYVSTRAEMNMASVCYMARHFAQTSRNLTVASIATNSIHLYAQYKEAKDA